MNHGPGVGVENSDSRSNSPATIGQYFLFSTLSIIFLGLAAGALVFVFNEMVATTRRFSQPIAANLALLVGFLIAIGA